MIFSFYYMILLFFIYSFLGWCIEVAFVAVTLGRVENRGFLNGPACPIYGVGMLGVLTVLTPVSEKWFLVFLGGMVICSAVELFGGWILDKIFHMRWWDYTDMPFNVGGYICLSFSIMWGIAVVFAVRMINPLIMAGIKRLPQLAGIIIICVLAVIFVVDMIVTLKNLIGIRKSLGQLDKLAEELQHLGDQLKEVVGNSAISVAEKTNDNIEDAKEKLESMSENTKEKIENVSETAREKIENVSETAREKIAARKEELEDKREELIKNIQKRNKRILNKLPNLNKSGKRINIKEYIDSLKKDK